MTDWLTQFGITQESLEERKPPKETSHDFLELVVAQYLEQKTLMFGFMNRLKSFVAHRFENVVCNY